jgi:hypothetical protein
MKSEKIETSCQIVSRKLCVDHSVSSGGGRMDGWIDGGKTWFNGLLSAIQKSFFYV